jgi:diphthine synthase
MVTLSICSGEIYFVGLGLCEKHITLEAAELLRRADRVFFEGYTSFYHPDVIDALNRIGVSGENVVVLSRRDLEDKSGEVLLREVLNGKKVALSTIGDPFIATTHSVLKTMFQKKGCRVKYVPSVNILSYSISSTGLFAYKFGESATIVYPRDGILSTYPYIVMAENLKRGLHTFFFLDIDEERGPLNAKEAVKLLLEAEKIEGRRAFSEEREVIVVERAAWPDERIILARAGELLDEDLNPPHSLIVPGNLHFVEKDSIEVFRI